MRKKNTPYKRQHWLPFSYLKGFADDPTNATREEARLYKFDGRNLRRVKVVEECREDFFYSRGDPKGAESKFWQMENDFPKFVKKLQSRHRLEEPECSGMIFNIFLLHFRNASYENKTDKERTEALDQAITSFFRKEVSEISDGKNRDIAEILRGLRTNWRLQKIISQGEKFITSDHPALFLCLAEENRLVMAGLPITPNLLVLAYDRRKIAIKSNKATKRDVGCINAYLAGQSIAAVYSSERFSDTEINGLKKIFKEKRRTHRGYFDEEYISMELIRYDKTPSQVFSFLEVK